MSMKRILSIALCLSILFTSAVGITGCGMKIQAYDLMDGITPNEILGKEPDHEFRSSAANFAVKLFQMTQDSEKNSMISPLSAMFALAMTANGADGETKNQMEKLLGGDIPLETLNEYLYSYVKNLPSDNKTKFEQANSIWFRDNGFSVEKAFLQKNADYYGAAAYRSAFDKQTLTDINNWVKKNTHGMIDKILDTIDIDAVMFVINTVLFEAEWQTIYSEDEIRDGLFTSIQGNQKTVAMMHSHENKYLKDEKATGFIKSYQNGYSFVALLPNEDVSLEEYIASMTGAGWIRMIEKTQDAFVRVALPKFSYDYEINMNEALRQLGMTLPFQSDKADFHKLGHAANGNIYISKVIQKTHIAVDGKGTKAGAATAVQLDSETAIANEFQVILNRPFVYAIIDNDTKLPLFIGTVTDIQSR